MIQFFLIFSFAAHIEAVPYPGSEEGIIGINNNNERTNHKKLNHPDKVHIMTIIDKIKKYLGQIGSI